MAAQYGIRAYFYETNANHLPTAQYKFVSNQFSRVNELKKLLARQHSCLTVVEAHAFYIKT